MTSPFTHVPRKRFTDMERARVFALRDGKCHRCTRKIGPADDWVLEHVLALELGGTNDIDNMDLSCSWCAKEKTAEDHADAGHARRAYTKHNVPSRFRKSRAWR